MTIRPAVAGEADALRDLARAAYAHYVERIGTEPWPMLADYTQLVEQGSVWVAARDHAIVGLIVLLPEEGHLLLDNVAVSPDAQGQGVGGRLLAFADEHARDLGYAEVRLYTNEAMTENIAYYPRHGYVETHRGEFGEYRRVHFTKTL
ncbi:GNAT family N-acetyltransferase [Solicola gregarius]|uniref:GNAT family N-acetyltransferase n=1 Tax=Solicola gregarius TaxID=2908642 RepID=A0AA46YLP5_9ACTN|nr:GNAT family N-acetyltransferase [Solicola gregarius]UYM06867.1 GNAT family N-acetyltransferase [Solicola gregarius]